ncbi:MAG: hypothetical protein PHV00_05965 [Syntrophales bacterium]|nr:hypothetical protein [Syntrophales bacterium]
MGGDIADLPVRRCPACGQVFVEDDRMYRFPDRCPACNTALEGGEKGEST